MFRYWVGSFQASIRGRGRDMGNETHLGVMARMFGSSVGNWIKVGNFETNRTGHRSGLWESTTGTGDDHYHWKEVDGSE